MTQEEIDKILDEANKKSAEFIASVTEWRKHIGAAKEDEYKRVAISKLAIAYTYISQQIDLLTGTTDPEEKNLLNELKNKHSPLSSCINFSSIGNPFHQ